MTHRTTCAVLAVLALALLQPGPSRAETLRVDDSASQVLASSVPMRWDAPAPERGRATQATGRVQVLARLDLRPWTGRSGRIYMTLPMTALGAVEASWTTRGVLLPGTVQSGGRTLVYAGPMTGRMLEDTLDLVLHADGGRLVHAEQLEFAFEIDLESL